MTKFIVAEASEQSKHAGSKPRTDIVGILKADGWALLQIEPKWERANPIRRLSVIPAVITDWTKIVRRVKSGDTVVFPYPLSIYPKISQIVLRFCHFYKKRG